MCGRVSELIWQCSLFVSHCFINRLLHQRAHQLHNWTGTLTPTNKTKLNRAEIRLSCLVTRVTQSDISMYYYDSCAARFSIWLSLSLTIAVAVAVAVGGAELRLQLCNPCSSCTAPGPEHLNERLTLVLNALKAGRIGHETQFTSTAQCHLRVPHHLHANPLR
jgi:hypothetical protein